MLMKYRTVPGVKGEVFMYFHSKTPLPGTDLIGPFSGPFYVSKEYAKRCILRGLNVEIVDPKKNKSVVKHRTKQPDYYDENEG